MLDATQRSASVTDFSTVAVRDYEQVRLLIKSGDILLCSGSSAFSKLIQQTTQSIWSHVAFIMRADAIDRIMVLESVESIGVRTVPLSNYVGNYNNTQTGYPGKLLIARHQDFKAESIKQLSKHAVDLLGAPYHTEEILEIAARILAHPLPEPPVSNLTLSNKSYICSEYAYECYRSVGIHIRSNPAGFVAPSDFATDPQIKPLFFVNIRK